MREQDKHFLWSLYVAIAVILAWKGIWESLREITYIGDPWSLLFLGFAMLTFSGVIFKEFDPLGSLDTAANKMIHFVHHHPHKNEFEIKYQDRLKKKDVLIKAERLKAVEKQTLIMVHDNGRQELFVPVHMVTEILHQGKPYWRF